MVMSRHLPPAGLATPALRVRRPEASFVPEGQEPTARFTSEVGSFGVPVWVVWAGPAERAWGAAWTDGGGDGRDGHDGQELLLQ